MTAGFGLDINTTHQHLMKIETTPIIGSSMTVCNQTKQRSQALALVNQAESELVVRSTLQPILELLAVGMTRDPRWENIPTHAHMGLLETAWRYLDRFERCRIASALLSPVFGSETVVPRTLALRKREYKVLDSARHLLRAIDLAVALTREEIEALEEALRALTDDSRDKAWVRVASAIDRLWLAGVGVDILNHLRMHLLNADPYDPSADVPFTLLPEEVRAVRIIGKWWR